MTVVRKPAVAGQFYANDAAELTTTVETLLSEVEEPGGIVPKPPKAIIAPHAGYIYSGPVAASAYARLRPCRDRYSKVVLLGPCHRVPVEGMALSDAEVFRTPMGDVPIDRAATASLTAQGLAVSPLAHQYEHSLEVHLPFLQVVLDDFSLVPIVVGDATPDEVARALDCVWGGDETLIVVSSDLSHYLRYAEARAFDAETCDAIEHFDYRLIDHSHACGATPVGGLLLAARRQGLSVSTIDLRNSADTSGDRRVVVGYGSWVFS
jgi:hypothetical protein